MQSICDETLYSKAEITVLECSCIIQQCMIYAVHLKIKYRLYRVNHCPEVRFHCSAIFDLCIKFEVKLRIVLHEAQFVVELPCCTISSFCSVYAFEPI